MTLAVNIAQGGSNNVTFRNRIINGGMVIDQRNAGASVVGSGSKQYILDRWAFWTNGGTGTAAYTVQQSSVAPAGFNNSILITQTAAYSPAATAYNLMTQYIEGYNVADLQWGTANAATVTLSFWVRSSLTGTFGGALSNSTQNRSYPFSYTISAANTWEYKTITIAGDTTGTWVKDSGIGIEVYWQIGVGSTYVGASGSWAGATYLGATGATNFTATNGATLYITGVQLEAGTTASPFEYRQYGTELALCQRYFYLSNPTNASQKNGGAWGSMYSTTQAHITGPLPVPMRAAPTFTFGGSSNTYYMSGVSATSAGSPQNMTATPLVVDWEVISMSTGSVGLPIQYNGQLSITAEL